MAEHVSAERIHGGVELLAALNVDPASVIDFSVNLNPYGPCAAVIDAARSAELARYPDPSAFEARSAWAAQLGCTAQELAVGHGAADLMWAIARAALSFGSEVVIAEPTFSEFRVAAGAAGAQVKRVFAPHLQLDLEALAQAAEHASALYLCSPNNPTGQYLAPAAIVELASKLPRCLLVLDQSFLGMSDHDQPARFPPNVLCVRSLTKEFACPGLRIAYCRGSAEWMARVEAQRPTWACSSPALAALRVAAHEQAFVRQSWQRLRADRDATRAVLHEAELEPLLSATSFQLVRVPGGASEFCRRMLRHGILLRDCTSFGLPDYVRIAALPQAARAGLRRALLDGDRPAR